MAEMYALVEKKQKTIFALSIAVMLFWVLAHTVDLYQYKVLGAVFEMMWFPMIIMLFLLPVINLTMLLKKSLNLKAFWIYALLLNAITVFLLFKLP